MLPARLRAGQSARKRKTARWNTRTVCPVLARAPAQSSGSTLTILWSWLLPTQKVVGVVELSTNTVRMLVSEGIRYCTAVPVLGSSRTIRSVLMVEAQRSEEHTSELQSRFGISYAVFC